MKKRTLYVMGIGVLGIGALVLWAGVHDRPDLPEKSSLPEAPTDRPSITITIQDEALRELRRIAAKNPSETMLMNIISLRDE